MGQSQGYLDYVNYDERLTLQERVDRGPFQSAFGVGHGDQGAAAIARAKERAAIASAVLDQVKEQAVFALLVDGLTVRPIAEQLGIPKSEVGRIAKRFTRDGDHWVSHGTVVYGRLGADNPEELREASREGIRAAWGHH